MVGSFKKFLHTSHDYLIVIALWILHTYIFELFNITPRLGMFAATENCGKSVPIDLCKYLAFSPKAYAVASASSLYRELEHHKHTFLIDEGDNIDWRGDKVMKAVVNSGHKAGGLIARTGKDGETKEYSTHAPLAIACISISSLASPILSRTIKIIMERTAEIPEEIDQHLPEFAFMRHRIIDFIEECREKDKIKRNPKMPEALMDSRDRDNWRVLIALADAIGGEWPKTVREIAVRMCGVYTEKNLKEQLIHDVRKVYDGVDGLMDPNPKKRRKPKTIDRITTKGLLARLLAMPNAPWRAMRIFGTQGTQAERPLTVNIMTSWLREFLAEEYLPLKPRAFRVKGSSKLQYGFLRSQFERAWSKWPDKETTPQQQKGVKGLEDDNAA
jgi:hypothetical protein